MDTWSSIADATSALVSYRLQAPVKSTSMNHPESATGACDSVQAAGNAASSASIDSTADT
ncbi:hypothetical protein [Roseiconus lacunae]|uniref:hypothetical protein n=1 Tax=Roseiconus lacunae TaxID=2605694 RepID=UPI001E40919A|nr:hypothetical protein [Roseiconus lacunae]